MRCKICLDKTVSFACAKLLQRYEVAYFKCAGCGFVQTEEPYWLNEGYADAIGSADVGLVRRNARQAKIVKAVIGAFFYSDRQFIDYGGGYGLLVRLLRDKGFDFYRWDAYCDNIFSRDFEAEPCRDEHYELLTAFELFEHLVSPLDEVEKMLGFSRNIFFTTELLPEVTPKPEEWWYYGLDYGQHISFFTKKSLSIIAERFSLNLVTDGMTRHLLTDRNVSSHLFNVISKYKVAALIDAIYQRSSLIPADYNKIIGKSYPHIPL